VPETVHLNRALVVIEAKDRDAANHAALQLDPLGGAGTFTAGLSPTGDEPATHYWCSVVVTNEQWRMLLGMREQYFPSAEIVEWYVDAEPQRPDRLLRELELTRIAKSLFEE
jgi:hypothetical protein